MGKTERKRRLVGPWRNLHGAIWLVGLAILFWRGWIWPGILVLIALSMALEGILMRFAPQAFEEEPAEGLDTPPVAATRPVVEAVPEHRGEMLPSNCPKCGGPIRGAEVKWTGLQSADCPYCGANLPMAMG
jgi:hypothetical protein